MKSQEYTGCAISSTRAVVVQRKFAPTLANGAEAGCDPLAITPVLGHAAPELLAFVADYGFRGDSGGVYGAFEAVRNRYGCGIVPEGCNAHHTSRVVVDDRRQPLAKRPALGQREWQPGCPKVRRCRNGREVDMPDRVAMLGDSPRDVNLMEATACGIVVKITEYGNTFEAAKLSMRLMVFLLSDSFQQHKGKKATVISDPAAPPSKGYSGFELAEKTVGLVGCGRVAQGLALMILPHCARVLGFDNHPRVDRWGQTRLIDDRWIPMDRSIESDPIDPSGLLHRRRRQNTCMLSPGQMPDILVNHM